MRRERAHDLPSLARDALHAVLARPRHVVLAALVAGLLAAGAPRWTAAALAAACAVAGAVSRRGAIGLAAALAVLVGAFVAEARLRAAAQPPVRPYLARAMTARAYAVEPIRARGFGGWSLAVRTADGPLSRVRLVLRAAARVRRPAVEAGDELRVRGRVVELSRWERYEATRGARAAVVAERVEPTGARRGGVSGAIDGVRRRAEASLDAGLPQRQAALARGMVLGQDDALDARTRDEFRASGLSHLLAASGANVALLALLATAGLGALGVRLRARLAAAFLLTALYVPLAGGGPSIQRAGVMGGAALVAALAGRPGSRAYALLLAAAVTLVLQPHAAADVGWQLSFAAVVAIALLAPRWRDALARRGLPAPVAEAAALTAAATVGTAPLLALHFEQVSVVSPIANLLAAPAVAPVVWLGTLAGLAGQIGAGGPIVVGLDAVAAFPLGFVGWVAHVAASAPHATVAVALGGPLAAIGAYVALAAAITSRRARGLVAGAALALAAVAAAPRLHPPAAPRALTVSFLDIGQGDATLVQHAGRAILVDTGPPDGPILPRLRAAGVRRLDLLVLTHAQADHEGAAVAVLRAVPVATVLDGGAGVRSPQRVQIDAALRRHGVHRLVPDAGEVVRAGPVRLDVLWPRQDVAAVPGSDPNDRAIVALLRDGAFAMLLTADAESPVTAPIAPPEG